MAEDSQDKTAVIKKSGTHKGGRKKGPSMRARLYAKGVLQGKSKKQAALDAGYSPSVAMVPASRIECHLGDLAEAVRKRISFDRIAQVIDEGLAATEIKLASFEGTFSDERKHPAYGERREYAKLAAMFGAMGPKDNPGLSNEVTVTIRDVDSE